MSIKEKDYRNSYLMRLKVLNDFRKNDIVSNKLSGIHEFCQ